MTSDADEPTVDLPEYRQFSLRAFFTIASGTAIILGLASWQPGFGTLLALVVVGPWWTWAAYRGRKGNLAYVLAPVSMGAVTLTVGAAVLDLDSGLMIGFLPIAVVCCGGPLLSALVLRRWVRKFGGRHPLLVGLAFVWLVILVYIVADIRLMEFTWYDTAGSTLVVRLILHAGWVVMLSLLVLAVSLPLTAPLSIGLAWLLWRIDARAIRWTEADLAALEAVRQLQAEREPAIHLSQVAERLGREHESVGPRLERLRQAGRLRWTYKAGYRAVD